MAHGEGNRAGAVFGSDDKQAKAKLCRVEFEEVAVALGPPARREIITMGAHCPLLGLRPDSSPHRYSVTDTLVEVCRLYMRMRVLEAAIAFLLGRVDWDAQAEDYDIMP